MAENKITTHASPETVFSVLSDPAAYEDWVVGSSDIRDADETWPAEDATFHHTQFIPRVGLKDTTTVLECTPPTRLVLCVRARPLVIAKVELKMRETTIGGTEITMIESPVGGIAGKLDNPLIHMSLRARNAESLRRLKNLAEQRTPNESVRNGASHAV
jgi:uncharacterized protein YndB with AHSA1/START domain